MISFIIAERADIGCAKPNRWGRSGTCEGSEQPLFVTHGSRKLAVQFLHRQCLRSSSILLVALLILVFAPAGYPFGEAGHRGISRWAFDLLQVKNSNGERISRFPYDYHKFFQYLDTASILPDAQPQENTLTGAFGLPNSAEHYYDPLDADYLCSSAILWQGTTLIEVVDGSGYNGLSGFLFYLVGGSPDDGNPTDGTLRDGALKFLRDFANCKTDEDIAWAEENFTMLLGCAFHYLEDIHSPGHTDWSSWWYAEGHNTCPFLYDRPPWVFGNWHIKCDGLGDAFFTSIEAVQDFDGCLEEFKPHRADFQDRRDDKETLPLIAYKWCNECPAHSSQVERNKPVLLNSDLAQLFHKAAQESRRTWDRFGGRGLEAYEPPEATFSVFCDSLEDSLESAAQECAGVIDWTFAKAAEGQNEIAERDAPNFLGIARAMATNNALDIPTEGQTIPGALHGADQDDFYPLKIPLGAWYFCFQTEGEAGLTMALYNDEGFTIAEGLDLLYSGSGVVYLRIFSSPQPPNHLLDCQYTVVVSKQDFPPLPGELLGRNLIVNGDAEQGEPSLFGEMVPVPCWTVTDGFTVVWYDPDSIWFPGWFPGIDCPGPENRGLNLFFGGWLNEWSAAWQSVDVSALQTPIDQGRISYALSGYLGGWEDQDDAAVLTVSFLDSSAKPLDAGSIGPVTPENRSYVTGLQQRRIESRVPAGTRKLDILLEMCRGEGFWNLDNDGYADNLELYLSVCDANDVTVDSSNEN